MTGVVNADSASTTTDDSADKKAGQIRKDDVLGYMGSE